MLLSHAIYFVEKPVKPLQKKHKKAKSVYKNNQNQMHNGPNAYFAKAQTPPQFSIRNTYLKMNGKSGFNMI
jgi:hypothetical protein